MRSFGYVLLALIVYGSIYPFSFGGNAMLRLPELLDFRHLIGSDVIENILAFVPMGVAFRLSADPARRRLDFILAAAIALLLQLIQLWIPSRQPALSDAIWNIAGLALGAWLTTTLRWVGSGSRALSPVGLALLALFGVHVYLALSVWHGVGGSYEQMRLTLDWRQSHGLEPALPWLAGILAAAPLLRPRLKTGARIAAVALLVVLLWQGLTPLTMIPRPFQWIPIRGLITGFSWGLAITLSWKLFAFGALTRLLMLSGVRARSASLVVVCLVLAIEIAQSRIGSGSPDITDPLLALLCAWGIVQEASVHAHRVGGAMRDGLRYFR